MLMSRRDIIIISVLLNASLLAVLFFMARHGDDEKVSEQLDIVQEIVALPETAILNPPSPAVQKIELIHPQDEIDDVLKDYAAPSASVSVLDDSLDDLDKEEEGDIFPMIAAAQEKDSENYLEITVKRGDALEKIARANGTTIGAIKKLNRLNSEKVFVGQVLRIPIVEKETAQTKPISAPKRTDSSSSSSAETEFYVIKSGDNPWKIAKLFHVKFDELLKLNNLDEEKARNLKVGDKIRVR